MIQTTYTAIPGSMLRHEYNVSSRRRVRADTAGRVLESDEKRRRFGTLSDDYRTCITIILIVQGKNITIHVDCVTASRH